MPRPCAGPSPPQGVRGPGTASGRLGKPINCSEFRLSAPSSTAIGGLNTRVLPMIIKEFLKNQWEILDILSRLPDYQPKVIFDVGANVGEVCVPLASAFPDCAIHAFEPVPPTFAALSEKTKQLGNVHCHNTALGSRSGSVRMWADGTSPGARVIKDPKETYAKEVAVSIERGDAFCSRKEIASISYLKIDTEGFDLEVLIGFGDILQATDFVLTEAAMNPHNKTHVPFRIIEDYLRHKGFYLFKFYEQSFEFFHGGHPVLRRANPLFINKKLLHLEAFS
jgi:FkbM family methyltransferase